MNYIKFFLRPIIFSHVHLYTVSATVAVSYCRLQEQMFSNGSQSGVEELMTTKAAISITEAVN